MLDTVQEIQERHSAVKDLERQLLGLHQIFLDMAVLVEAQGDMLDNIETQARAACSHRLSATRRVEPVIALTLRAARRCRRQTSL